MVRLTWLQFRVQTFVVLAALALVAIAVVLTEPQLAHIRSLVATPCETPGSCVPALIAASSTDIPLQMLLSGTMLAAPALLGIFWGAPLVARELESGTFRLIWTQSVSRRRWLAVKLGVVGLASAAAAGLLSLLVTWWFGPIDLVNANRFDPAVFDVRGIVPVGYALFAFAVGVTAGVLIPRVLPAMAVSLAVYVGVRVVMTFWVRPHLLPPVRQRLPFVMAPGIGMARTTTGLALIAPTPKLPNAWVYANVVVDQTGHAPSTAFLQSACPSLAGGLSGAGPIAQVGGAHTAPGPGARPGLQACVSAVAARFHQVVTYQPADRYWVFQGIETAIYVGLGLLLAGLCLWWVQRRVA
ncbi:MAG TPA: hypothetical protein VFN57_13435 [Thermomicrobiaceae bacterium]|nr:hypothetical protein [Thermomicrobiaceae bacterium]